MHVHCVQGSDYEPMPAHTAQRTVIIQHRVRDYGLGYCAVKVEFSRKTKHANEHAVRAYGYIGESPYLTLWRLEDLDTKAVLASSALPTSSASRKEFLGDIALDGMHSVQSPFFECGGGSIQTLEIAVACTSEPCIMEFRLMRSPRRQGMYIFRTSCRRMQAWFPLRPEYLRCCRRILGGPKRAGTYARMKQPASTIVYL